MIDDDELKEGELLEEEAIERSADPADWRVYATNPKTNVRYDFKRQRKAIAEGLRSHWERRGFRVELVYEPQPTPAPASPQSGITAQEDSLAVRDLITKIQKPQDPYKKFTKALGQLLRRCRKAEGLTQSEFLAKIAENATWAIHFKLTTQSGFSRMETGTVKMTPAQIAVFAEFFGLKPSEFVKLAEDMSNKER
jgi:hypothetical protein